MSNLTRAITIAAKVHENQVDKGGSDYILHPLRLMMRMQSEETRIVALLHDVIEDSPENDPWTSERLLNEGFTNEEGYQILWQFADSVKGDLSCAVRNWLGRWDKFVMDIGDLQQRQEFQEGKVPKNAKRL